MRIGLLFILLLNKGFTYAQVIDESKREAFTFTYEHISLIDKEHKTYKQIEDSALSVPAGQSRSGELYRQASQVNDNCVTAIPLVINGGDYTYSNAGATGSGTDPVPSTWSSCTGGPSNNVLHTVWFKFVVLAGPKNITVSSTGNTVNRTILRANYAVYSGTCGALVGDRFLRQY
jgi:hypothetical protein